MKKEDPKKAAMEKKICKYLSNLTFKELKELNINGQQMVKIKAGEIVRFYTKTFDRLKKLVEKK